MSTGLAPDASIAMIAPGGDPHIGDDVADDPSTGSDMVLVNALRHGDEAAFADLVHQLHPSMVRLAQLFVRADTPGHHQLLQPGLRQCRQRFFRYFGRTRCRGAIGGGH